MPPVTCPLFVRWVISFARYALKLDSGEQCFDDGTRPDANEIVHKSAKWVVQVGKQTQNDRSVTERRRVTTTTMERLAD